MTQKVEFSPHVLKTHASELQVATEFQICWSGYTAVWHPLVKFSDYDEEQKDILQEIQALVKESIIRFMVLQFRVSTRWLFILIFFPPSPYSVTSDLF
jgi:hypothetical protein